MTYLFIFAFLLLSRVFASYEGIKILEVSSSKKTFKINIGNLEGVRKGEVGRFYINIPKNKTDENKRILKEVVSAYVVKSDSSSSIWYVKEGLYFPALEKNTKMILFRTSKVLKGKRNFKVKRKKIVFSSSDDDKKNDIKDSVLKQYKRGYSTSLIKRDKNYWYGKKIKDTDLKFEEDIELADLKVWKTQEFNEEFNLLLQEDLAKSEDRELLQNKKLTQFDYDSEFNSLLEKKDQLEKSQLKIEDDNLADLDELTDLSIDEGEESLIAIDDELQASDEEVLDSLEQEQFDLLVRHGTNQIENQKFELSNLGSQYNDDFGDSDPIKLRSTVMSLKQKQDHEKLFSQKRKKRALEKIQQDGPRWSDDLSDKQLRNFIVKNGLEKEKKRQGFFENNNIDNEISISMGMDLLDNASVDDTDNGSTPINFRFSYEFYFSRLSLEWAKWSVQGSITKGSNTYDLNGINGKSKESVGGASIRYYFYNYPTTMNDYSLYLGLGYESGVAKMSNGSWDVDSIDYTISMEPKVEMGFKYRYDKFSDKGAKGFGMGFNGSLSYELVNISTAEQEANDLGLYTSANYNTFKMNVGIGFYF